MDINTEVCKLPIASSISNFLSNFFRVLFHFPKLSSNHLRPAYNKLFISVIELVLTLCITLLTSSTACSVLLR